MSVVTLAQASTIVDAALKKGRDTNCAPLTVAVLDVGGHLVAFKLNVAERRSARALPFSPAHNPVSLPPAVAT